MMSLKNRLLLRLVGRILRALSDILVGSPSCRPGEPESSKECNPHSRSKEPNDSPE